MKLFGSQSQSTERTSYPEYDQRSVRAPFFRGSLYAKVQRCQPEQGGDLLSAREGDFYDPAFYIRHSMHGISRIKVGPRSAPRGADVSTGVMIGFDNQRLRVSVCGKAHRQT